MFINIPLYANCDLEKYKAGLGVIEDEINSDAAIRYFKGKLNKENIFVSTYLMQFHTSNFLLSKDSSSTKHEISKKLSIYDSLYFKELNNKEFKLVKNYFYCPELNLLSSKENFEILIFLSEVKEGMFFAEIRFYNKNYGTNPADYGFANSGNFLKVLFFTDEQNKIQFYQFNYLAG